MRELILDIETTGLDVNENRIIEIGFVELLDGRPTGLEYQQYFNPERDIEEEAQKVHGIEGKFLQNKPVFFDKVDELLGHFNEAQLVIHNAEFDLGFINKELELCNRSKISPSQVLDSLELARKVLPEKGQHSLDALCNHYNIDLSLRSTHSALVDAQYLSEVYKRLKQETLQDLIGDESNNLFKNAVKKRKHAHRPVAVQNGFTEEEKELHQNYVKTQLGPNSIWKKLNYV